MSVHALLAELRRRDIRVRAEGERLVFDAPADGIEPTLRERLRQHKEEVLEFLRSAERTTKLHRAIVPVQPRGPGVPIFGVGGHNGDVFCFLTLAERLGLTQPFYGLQPPGLDGLSTPLTDIPQLAAYFAGQITAFYPSGPLVVTGFCAGGMTAFELGRQLLQAGREVSVVLLGGPYPTTYRPLAIAPALLQARWSRLRRWAGGHWRAIGRLSARGKLSYVRDRLRRRGSGPKSPAAQDPVLELRRAVERATIAAARRYTPAPFEGPLFLFVPSRRSANNREKQLRWRSVAPNAVVYFGPDGCTRDEMLHDPFAGAFADRLRGCASGASPEAVAS